VATFVQDQDKNALGVLFERYHHLIVAVCYKYYNNSESAKDATMQVFEKLITTLPKQDIQNFKAWLLTVSKNHCLMDLRKKKLPITITPFIENLNVESDQNLHLLQEKEDNLEKMMTCMAQIEEKQRLCLELFYLQDKSYAAIQEQTGFDFMEVKSFIQNGKRKLKLLMQQEIE
jgi:RNA polymerase sigma factor (sigma-70 family)